MMTPTKKRRAATANMENTSRHCHAQCHESKKHQSACKAHFWPGLPPACQRSRQGDCSIHCKDPSLQNRRTGTEAYHPRCSP
eukprot:5583522-Pleurochrysis_carterae.AAC.3